MSRIGSSGHPDTHGFSTAEDGLRKGGSRQSRFDDGSKGLGSHDAGLGQRGGSDGRTAAEHGAAARTSAFGRSLEEALGQHKAAMGTRDRGEPESKHGSDADVSALLASLSSQPSALAPAAKQTDAKSAAHDQGAVGSRHTGLKDLWAKDPDQGRVAPSSSTTGLGSEHAVNHAADGAKPKRVLHLLAEIDPARVADAVSRQPPGMPVPSVSDGSATAGGAPDGAPPRIATSERVEHVAERVAEAIRLENAVPPGQTVTLNIPLDTSGAGTQNLTVSLTATGVEVSLARDAGDASAALLGAARDLAERLQRRFPNRSVRIYDAVRPPMAFGQVGATMATPLSDTDDL